MVCDESPAFVRSSRSLGVLPTVDGYIILLVRLDETIRHTSRHVATLRPNVKNE